MSVTERVEMAGKLYELLGNAWRRREDNAYFPVDDLTAVMLDNKSGRLAPAPPKWKLELDGERYERPTDTWYRVSGPGYERAPNELVARLDELAGGTVAKVVWVERERPVVPQKTISKPRRRTRVKSNVSDGEWVQAEPPPRISRPLVVANPQPKPVKRQRNRLCTSCHRDADVDIKGHAWVCGQWPFCLKADVCSRAQRIAHGVIVANFARLKSAMAVRQEGVNEPLDDRYGSWEARMQNRCTMRSRKRRFQSQWETRGRGYGDT